MGNSREPPALTFFGPNSRYDEKSRGDEPCVKAAPLQGADRIGLASEAAAPGKNKKGPPARPFSQNKNKRLTVKPAPRSDRLALPVAATAILPDDCQPGLTESAAADSATCRC